MTDWRAFSVVIESADQAIDEHELGDWNDVLTDRSLPDSIKTIFPDGAGVRFMRDLVTAPDDLIFALLNNLDVPARSKSRLIKGVDDAEIEPDFQAIHARFGWRSLIYVLISFGQSPVPDHSHSPRYHINWQIPAVFFSKMPNAFDSGSFQKLYLITLFTLVSKTLRFGLTWTGTRANRLFESIPGVVSLISSELVYEANQEFARWFPHDLKPGEAVSLGSILPRDLHAWIRTVILDEPSEEKTVQSKIDWIRRRDGRKVRAEIEIRPFKPFEFVHLHESMNLGYQGLNTRNVDELLHLMFIRDVSVQFEAERVMQEIELARKVQVRLLPSRIPWTDRFDVAADCQPAGDIGGDLFDVTLLEDGRLALFTCDATGHGIDSAMLASMVSGAYRASVLRDPVPARILETLDQVLRKTRQSGFVTAAYLLLNPTTRTMEIALAGHHPPLHLFGKEILHPTEVPASLPLGVTLPPCYHLSSQSFKPGDVIAIMSDGLLEARNRQNDVFDTSIGEVLLGAAHQSASGILNTLFKSFRRFRDGIPAEDDLTAVVVKIKS